MKELLFNIYKAYYSADRKNHPKSSHKSIKNSASFGVFSFLMIVCLNIFMLSILLGVKYPVTYVSYFKLILLPVFIFIYAVFPRFMFKFLRLEDLDYSTPENRLDRATRRRTWFIFTLNGVILFGIIILWILLKYHLSSTFAN